jgi:hypothetical protein
VFPKSPGDSDFWTIARTKVSPIQGKHSFTEHQNDIRMETYCVKQIQNIGMLNLPKEAIRVAYESPDGQIIVLGDIGCGKSANTYLGDGWQLPSIQPDNELKVLLSYQSENPIVVKLRNFVSDDGSIMEACLVDDSWHQIDGQSQPGDLYFGVALPNGGSGILVIGTVDIGDE